MFSTVDKALVALIGAIVYLASALFGIEFTWLTTDMIQNAVTFLTPLLVWLVPNKTA
jgi:uncharacterized membrane protein